VDLYVVRHAIAEPRSVGLRDADRELTAEGIARFEREVRGLKRLGIELDAVVHSPWRRAVQTAERLRPVAPAARWIASDLLVDDPARALLRLLDEAGASVAAVGHEPWMSELVAWLAVGDADLGGSIPMKKGAVAWLRGPVQPGQMALRGLWAPKHLRAVGRGQSG
jgi:phosphohistidine phosphatase